MTHITTEVDEEPLIRLAFNVGVLDVNLLGGELIYGTYVYLVFLNGKQASLIIKNIAFINLYI